MLQSIPAESTDSVPNRDLGDSQIVGARPFVCYTKAWGLRAPTAEFPKLMNFKVFTRSGLLIFPFGDVNITLVKIKRAFRFSGETLRQALRAVLKGCPN